MVKSESKTTTNHVELHRVSTVNYEKPRKEALEFVRSMPKSAKRFKTSFWR